MDTKGFTELTGSPKQIAWANRIRADFFSYLPVANEKVEEAFTAIINKKTSAKWWIEEVANKAMIDSIEVMKKCADMATGRTTDVKFVDYVNSLMQEK